MAQVSYREAVAAGLAQELARDERVVLIGEDVAAAGGIYGATRGLLERFGPRRVRDTPISEQAIVGAAMGAAMTGLRPVVEIMYSDFLAVCWDMVANQVAKARYMTAGQLTVPLVVRTANGAGLRYGAQHSQSVENWAMSVPGLKVVAPSTPADAKGMLAAAIRDDDPVLVFEHKKLYGKVGEVPEGEHVVPLGHAVARHEGDDLCMVALGAMVDVAVAASERLRDDGIEAGVLDLRCLVPLDVSTVLAMLRRSGRLLVIEENPRLCGWGAELVSIVVEEAFELLRAPPIRVTTPHVPLPAAAQLEDATVPTVARVIDAARALLDANERSWR